MNNVKFAIKAADNGKMSVLKVIQPGTELFVQYNSEEQYDWNHVIALRTSVMLHVAVYILNKTNLNNKVKNNITEQAIWLMNETNTSET